MHKVIVNSTPVITLCNIGEINILRELYGTVTVPSAVYREVTAKSDSACQQISSLSWIHVEEVKDVSQKVMYAAKLHDGEVEVMVLAQESPEDTVVIIDDNAAKKTAKYLGLNVTGTLGVLVKAKREGIIKEISPILVEMKDKGFYISEDIERFVLEKIGEASE